MAFTSEEDERAFLQRRVALYARVSLGFLVTFVVMDLVTFPLVDERLDVDGLAGMQRWGLGVEIGVAVLLGLAGWFAGRGHPSQKALYILDGVTTLLLCGSLGLLIWPAPVVQLPIELMVFLAILGFLFLHAALVPAPAFRTAAIHVVACVPLFLVSLDRAERVPAADDLWRWGSVYGLGVWIVTFAAIAAVISHVVYGLRVRIRAVARLGQYQLDSKLGEGAMGIVYRGHHSLLRRPTAIKMLPTNRAGERAVARFEREVRLTSRLTHPNTVAIYDFGRTPEGVFYYAMELLEGLDLAEAVALGGPMPPARVIHILRQCAGALEEAHRIGLVHRDLKPQNILLCHRGGIPDTAKVVDFGLVKDLEAPKNPTLSRADVILGTPLYMAPESITTPDDVDGRADLYALGAVGWFLLVGRPPFEGKSVVEVCAKHIGEQPMRPSDASDQAVPSDLEAIILQLLSKRPEERLATAEDLERALAGCADAGGWTRAAASRWWSEHGDAIRALRAGEEVPEGTLTIAIERS